MAITTKVRGRVEHMRRMRRREAARKRLLAQIPTGLVGAEIGVWKGDFTARLLPAAKPAQLHLIDPWKYQPEYDRAWFGGRLAQSQDDMDEIFESVLRRFDAEVKAGQVVVHRALSEEAAADFAPASLDWVYVDGNHEYAAVLEDLRAFSALLRPGGLLMGDDYADSGWWGDGVNRAVDEWVADGNAELIGIYEDQFLLRVPVPAAPS